MAYFTNSATGEYERALARLNRRERYEPAPRSRGPEKLAGFRELMQVLGEPGSGLRVVHIAGTNGKGTTAAMVAALLGAVGKRVGVYSSPNLRDIRERILVDGAMLSRANFAEVSHTVLDAAETISEANYLSYFDILTAMGWWAFRRAGVEWAVVEVGLGGRSDATNTVDKELAILTRIGWDHMQVLGGSLAGIAEEKAGIARPGVPTIVAQQEPEIQALLARRLGEIGSPLVLPVDLTGAAFYPEVGEGNANKMGFRGPRAECAAAALAAANLLLGPADGERLQARLQTLAGMPMPGRLEVREQVAIRGEPALKFRRILLDGGHNRGALTALNEELNAKGWKGYTLIFTLQRDKMVAEVREPLGVLLKGAARVICPAPLTPRGVDAGSLAGWLGEGAPALEPVDDVREALLAALRPPGPPVVVAGSFWMLGALMNQLALPPAPEADGWPPVGNPL